MENDEITLVRPTIRIEIKNDIVNDEMDVVNEEVEDGEISDNEQIEAVKIKNNMILNNKWINKDGGFTTGIDIFSKDEQEKLSARAERFGIQESKSIGEDQVHDLYESLNLTPGDEKILRLDAVHMRGVEEMSTKDVFGYFNAFAPSSIEWINDFSCNVVWLDNISASRALYGLSKRIHGLSDYLKEDNPFIPKNDTEEVESDTDKVVKSRKCRSILLIEQDQQNQLQDEWDSEDPINISEIPIPIPPGYWRYGKSHPKAKAILLRFAFKTDKKPLRAEKLSEYYKKYGNPNYGGLKGLISQSRKRLMRREVRINNVDMLDSKNPWGSLAANWNNEDRGVISLEPKEILPERMDTIIPIVSSIQERIGTKRRHLSADDDHDGIKIETDSKRKLPRMRMYADEEQERLNRLKAIKLNTKVDDDKSDLRNRLRKHVKPLPQLTIRLTQTLDTKKSTILDRLGTKVERKYSEDEQLLRDRISERLYNSDEEQHDNSKQKSTVQVVVHRKSKPSIASIVSRGPVRQTERSWRLSDRKQFRHNNSSRSHSPRRRERQDLRNKISSVRHRIKKEKASSSSSDDSESDESSNGESSSNSSAESSSSSSSTTSSEQSDQFHKHTSILKKTALSAAEDNKFSVKNSLRIEVKNDSYKKT